MTHAREHPEPKKPHRVIAERVRQVRTARGLTAARLAEAMTETGIKWDRSVVANLENGRRSTVSVEELFALAFVLDVAPVHLTVPLERDGWLKVTPDASTSNERARAWIRGLAALPGRDERKYFSEVPEDEWKRPDGAQVLADLGEATWVQVSRSTGDVTTYDRDTGEWSEVQQPVVAAIVTSPLGVLVGRRNDGKPPWTFIAGEQDAVKDENPADTAVREVKEETGLRVTAGEVIGERVHPKTGRTMIYLAAKPTHGTDIFVGDEDELAEVRWVGLAEADELLPGMFEPVREHLERELGGDAR